MAPSRREEHDVFGTVRLYKDTMDEDRMEFGDPLASVRAPTQQELKISERVTAYYADGMDKVPRIDKFEEERSKWKVHHLNFRKYRASVSSAMSSRNDYPSLSLI